MSILHYPETKLEKRVLTVLLAVSGVTILLLLIVYFLNPRPVIGDALVNTASGTPFEIPPADVSPLFHVKPITVFFVALVVFGYSLFSLLKNWISRIPSHLRILPLMVSVLALAVCVYEVFFNFALWTALMITQTSNPDHAINGYPGGFLQINLVFATKTFVALLFISYFAFDGLRKRDTTKQSLTVESPKAN